MPRRRRRSAVSFGFIIASVLDADVGGSDQELHEGEDQLRLLVGRHDARGAAEAAADSAASSRGNRGVSGFIDSLPRRSYRRSLIATVDATQGIEQIAERRERVDGDYGRAECRLCTGGIEHPRRQRAERVIGESTEDVLAMPIACAPPYRQRLAVQRMPPVIHRDRLRMMGIM